MCVLFSIFGFQQKWLSPELQYVGLWTVWYSCINTKSAWRSAADVKVLLTSSIFLPVPSRPPCCSAPRCIKLCRVKGVESMAPPGHQPSDTCAYESQQQCQQHDQHASYSCLTHACKTTLSVDTQHRPENILTTDCTGTLNGTSLIAHFRPCQIQVYAAHRVLGGDRGSYESCNMILFDWMHQVQIGFPLTPPPLPA